MASKRDVRSYFSAKENESKKNQNQIKYLFLLQVYIGPINSKQYLHVKNRQ